MKWSIDHRSAERLQDQIAQQVRTLIASGELSTGERLPPASELATALSVDRNTVLAAYHQLREEGLLEFRRGRGTRVAESGSAPSSVTTAVNELLALARSHGLDQTDLIRTIKELS